MTNTTFILLWQLKSKMYQNCVFNLFDIRTFNLNTIVLRSQFIFPFLSTPKCKTVKTGLLNMLNYISAMNYLTIYPQYYE